MKNQNAERNPDGAAGDWFIDQRCINCAAARHVAPGLIVERDDFSVFARQPSTKEELEQAWLAAELCPTRSIRTESRLKPPPGLYPHELSQGIYLCGHNARSSFGAHSYFVERSDGNLLIDAPQFTRKLVAPFEEQGGIGRILLSHRDDVADADKWARHFDAEVYIHKDDRQAAPYATHIIAGRSPAEVTVIAPGLVAIPVPGHTKGSVVYLLDETFLFTGDSLAWNLHREDLYAFKNACWYSWAAQKRSLTALADYRFERVFSGHGSWSPRRSAKEMKERLLALTSRM